ncbi:MAG: flagellar basal body rod protein FlgC [Pseudomonadota bacterium]
MDDLGTALQISASGLRAQSTRIRVVAENLANANSTAANAFEDPYRRQIPVFSTRLDRDIDASLVSVSRVTLDPSAFSLRYDPSHPAANDDGYIQLPNVNPLIEMMDMREAQRTYEANLGAMELTRTMARATLRILE